MNKSSDPKECNACHQIKPLTDFYWTFHNDRGTSSPQFVCKSCSKKVVAKWQSFNREKVLGYKRKWAREHPEKGRLYKDRRERDLPTDFILNKSFEGAHLHHVTPSVAIYIPSSLHNDVRHNLRTGWRMDEINNKAMEWWLQCKGV